VKVKVIKDAPLIL